LRGARPPGLPGGPRDARAWPGKAFGGVAGAAAGPEKGAISYFGLRAHVESSRANKKAMKIQFLDALAEGAFERALEEGAFACAG